MIRHAPWAEGPADFAIGLGPIAEADWFEGGEDDPAARKDPLLEAAFAETEGSRPAQAEALALVEHAAGRPGDPALPPLHAASRLVSDDLCLMEKRGGEWTLTALSLSAPTFFTAREAVGKSLSALHGPVPGFETRFLTRVGRIFDGLREGLILQRRNWTVLNTGELHTPDPAPVRARIGDVADPGAELFVRVERQTLRRLPSGALFTIRVWTHPLEALLDDPERLAAFARAWRTASAEFRAYKHLHLYDGLVEQFLSKSRA
ncbi:MAG TPA: heme-dependent oxidative N-demethylase subunit alpha family protein [Caulobacteraceae bacterium]|nr:heme-dependent oxidative N-demethylase subunit alpha family protein [Caulobacteraceae bacterium]